VHTQNTTRFLSPIVKLEQPLIPDSLTSEKLELGRHDVDRHALSISISEIIFIMIITTWTMKGRIWTFYTRCFRPSRAAQPTTELNAIEDLHESDLVLPHLSHFCRVHLHLPGSHLPGRFCPVHICPAHSFPDHICRDHISPAHNSTIARITLGTSQMWTEQKSPGKCYPGKCRWTKGQV
jgi:hypothetical protein